jgi:hypothetical protein
VTGATGTGNMIGCTDKGNNIIANGVYNSSTDGYEWDFYNGQNVEVDATYNYFICICLASFYNHQITQIFTRKRIIMT